MNWVALARVTAVSFGAYNVFIKLGAGKIDQVLGAVVLQLVAAALGGAYALSLKVGGRDLGWSKEGLAYAALAGVAVGLAEILTFVVFARGAPAALATPIIMGGSTLVVALVGVVALGERVGLTQVAGILLVAGGISLLSRGVAH
jgi:bacterial/archaeal transporter family protein